MSVKIEMVINLYGDTATFSHKGEKVTIAFADLESALKEEVAKLRGLADVVKNDQNLPNQWVKSVGDDFNKRADNVDKLLEFLGGL